VTLELVGGAVAVGRWYHDDYQDLPVPDFPKFIDTRFSEAAVQILGRR
jgi:hypothetical protein